MHPSRHSRGDSLTESLGSVSATVIRMIMSGKLGGYSRVSVYYDDEHQHVHDHHDDEAQETSQALVTSESMDTNAHTNGTYARI